MIVCRETDKKSALLLEQRVCMAVEKYTFATNRKQTLSIGVSSFSPKDRDMSMLGRAEKALYTVKQRGRNRAEFQ